MERARDAGRLRPLGSPADGFGPQGDPRARAHPPLRQGLPVCQPRIRLGELRRHGISISMTECGDPKENAQAERVNGTMKNELLKGMVFRDIAQARSAIGRAVEFYNKERPNMSIDMMTPSEAAARTGEIKKRWTSYRLAAIKSKQEGLIVPENSLPLQQSRPAAGIPAAQ